MYTWLSPGLPCASGPGTHPSPRSLSGSERCGPTHIHLLFLLSPSFSICKASLLNSSRAPEFPLPIDCSRTINGYTLVPTLEFLTPWRSRIPRALWPRGSCPLLTSTRYVSDRVWTQPALHSARGDRPREGEGHSGPCCHVVCSSHFFHFPLPVKLVPEAGSPGRVHGGPLGSSIQEDGGVVSPWARPLGLPDIRQDATGISRLLSLCCLPFSSLCESHVFFASCVTKVINREDLGL